MQTTSNSHDASEPTSHDFFPDLSPGQKLAGCYVLKEEKRASTTASIWHAYDEVLGKDVALHFIPKPVRGDEKAMDELRHLTKRNRQLIHPHILRIYDLIEEGDWAAISTDAVEGECLAELQRKRAGGFFEVAEVKPWVAQLCQTLDDAHRIQLIHGDLSPEHLFLNDAGRVVVANFGIGRSVRDSLWRANASAGGTPPVENLSPQVLDGHAPTTSDDIYGAGILLHTMLAGQPPFTDPDLSEKIHSSNAMRVIDHRTQLQKAGGPIPPNWEKVIASCLEKTPEQRPKSLADLSARLALPKPDAKASESAESAPRIESAASPANAEEAAIPVVKKAWVGPMAAGASPAITPAVPAIEENQLDDHDYVDGLDPEPAQKNALSHEAPLSNTRRSGFPVTGVAAAAILGGLCVYAVFFDGFRNEEDTDPSPVAYAESFETPEDAPVENEVPPAITADSPIADALLAPEPPAVPVVEKAANEPPVAALATSPVVKTEPADHVESPAFPPKPFTDPVLTLVANPKPAKKGAPPVATPIAVPAAETGSSVSARTAALDAARKSVDEWDKTHAALLKKKEQAEASTAQAKKTLEEKLVTTAPMLKASEEIAALKQKREEELRAAELAAAEAKKAAEEKARLAEEAKQAVANVEKENKDKLLRQKEAEAQLDGIKKVIAENERLAAENNKLAEEAMAKKGEQTALVKKREQDLALAMAAAAIEAQKKQELEEKRNRIMKEMDEAKKLFEERMKALESSLKNPDAGSAPSEPAREKAPPEPKPTPAATPPPAAAAPIPPSPTPEVPNPASAAAEAAPAPAAEPTVLAKMEKVPLVAPIEPKPAPTTAASAAANSLGINFVPVGDVQFAIWPTRLKDFEAFATATGLKSSLWRDPGFKQGPDHPVVNVTWQEAMLFCKWLTAREQREGTLPAGKTYRLPTDLEWSKAVGLPEESGKTAEARDMGVPDVYPWGTTWPPPPGAGNYTGEETGSDVAIKGYSDGFPWTSPAGSFPPNQYGLYDMGGNVWQWVMDTWNTESTSKVLRGASWYNGALKLSLLSSCRVHAAPDSSTDNYGFRLVIANESSKPARR